MKSKLLALLVVGLLVPGICSAQSLKPGKWTGSAVPPDGEEVQLTYDVTVDGDSLGVVIHAGEHGDFTAHSTRYADKAISFTFEPGVPVHCVLTLNAEGAYAGHCLGDDGSDATMVMVPPKE